MTLERMYELIGYGCKMRVSSSFPIRYNEMLCFTKGHDDLGSYKDIEVIDWQRSVYDDNAIDVVVEAI